MNPTSTSHENLLSKQIPDGSPTYSKVASTPIKVTKGTPTPLIVDDLSRIDTRRPQSQDEKIGTRVLPVRAVKATRKETPHAPRKRVTQPPAKATTNIPFSKTKSDPSTKNKPSVPPDVRPPAKTKETSVVSMKSWCDVISPSRHKHTPSPTNGSPESIKPTTKGTCVPTKDHKEFARQQDNPYAIFHSDSTDSELNDGSPENPIASDFQKGESG